MADLTISLNVDPTAADRLVALTLTIDGKQVASDTIDPTEYRAIVNGVQQALGDAATAALAEMESWVTDTLRTRETTAADVLKRNKAAASAWTKAAGS